MDFVGKNIFILGAGISGIAAANKLAKLQANIYIFDDNKTAPILRDENIIEFSDQIKFCHYKYIDWPSIDYFIISPGIATTFPKPHPAVTLAKKFKVKIASDIELFLNLVPKANIIAVTGTNGKSTTTELIYHILKTQQKTVYIAGNIGIGIFDLEITNDSNTYYILELSSYQLELFEKSYLNIGILLNITPDHIDRHGSLENYIAAKKNIFLENHKKQNFIIATDDQYCSKIYRELSAKGAAIAISNDNQEATAFFDGKQHISYHGKIFKFPYDPSYFGNKQNILASITAANLCDISIDNAILALKTFKPLEHRMEFLGKIFNTNIINDSKATNAASSLNAISQLKNIYWIAGGVSKEGGIADILPYLDRIHKIFLIGKSQNEFATQLDSKNYRNYSYYDNLDEAFFAALRAAQGDIKTLAKNKIANILFSPAAASFDMWQNFMARGTAFKKLYYYAKNNEALFQKQQ